LATSIFLLLFSTILTGPLEAVLADQVNGAIVSAILQTFLLVPGITTIMVLFPDGRFVPRWTRWLLMALVPWMGAVITIPALYLTASSQAISFEGSIWFLFPVVIGFGAQIYRYRRISSFAERQQTKWVLLGFAAWIASILLSSFTLYGKAWLPSDPATLVAIVIFNRFMWSLGLTFIPISFALALHRYRLWDIDFIINRSLVYGALTLILIGLLAGAFFAIRELLGLVLGGDESTIAIVAATLIVAGAFNPARRLLRHLVDQHLYHIGIDYTPAKKAVPQSVAAPRSTLGTYEGLELIGRGGMAEVYKANHPTLRRPVAIKVLPHSLAQDPDFRKRFEREAQTVAALKHPNIVQLFDFGEADGTSFMVIEYIGGPDVGDVIKQGGLSVDRALAITREVAGALDYAHQQGLVHRDIKPSNVMLESITVSGKNNRNERSVLMDFGIARILGGNTRLTASGMIGTLDYMSPEQIKDAKDVDGRADIYSLGIMLFQMLTGRLPFAASNPGALLIAHLNQPAPDPRTIRADIPEDASLAVLKAMEKNADDRYQTAGEFAAALA
jgi:tRNA A-37 threonylcarbamoyl transferase component Bud32